MVDHGTGSIRVLHEERAGRVYVRAVTQLEISSTELRALIIASRDPRYLVPDAVRQIILETRCYAPPQDRRAP
jgi:nicotinate-nucleotide adenylyltransferase